MSEKITKEFYSNCLFEAIKTKIKHPVKTKIKYLPAHLNEVYCPHWMWHDGEYTYDFYRQGKLKWYQFFWHKGYIRMNEYHYYEKVLKAMKEWKSKHGNK